MNIYKVNKIMSSENKSKLIAHFWSCKCKNCNVSHIIKKLNISQSNLSKHITVLLKLDVLKCKQKKKERYYEINQKWKKEWEKIIEPQVHFDENKKFMCTCTKKENNNE